MRDGVVEEKKAPIKKVKYDVYYIYNIYVCIY